MDPPPKRSKDTISFLDFVFVSPDFHVPLLAQNALINRYEVLFKSGGQLNIKCFDFLDEAFFGNLFVIPRLIR